MFNLYYFYSTINFRRKLNSDDPSLLVLERRLSMLEDLRDLTNYIQTGQDKEIPAVALSLESNLAGDPDELILHVFYCLMGALFKTYDIKMLTRERDNTFGALLKIWSKDAERCRLSIESIIGENPHIS